LLQLRISAFFPAGCRIETAGPGFSDASENAFITWMSAFCNGCRAGSGFFPPASLGILFHVMECLVAEGGWWPKFYTFFKAECGRLVKINHLFFASGHGVNPEKGLFFLLVPVKPSAGAVVAAVFSPGKLFLIQSK
jgi:hypothetical protein